MSATYVWSKGEGLSRSEPQPLNPECQAHDQDDAADSEGIAVDDIDDPFEHASQVHILKVMELIGCDEGTKVLCDNSHK